MSFKPKFLKHIEVNFKNRGYSAIFDENMISEIKDDGFYELKWRKNETEYKMIGIEKLKSDKFDIVNGIILIDGKSLYPSEFFQYRKDEIRDSKIEYILNN